MRVTHMSTKKVLATMTLGALVATGLGVPLVTSATPAAAATTSGTASVSANADAYTDTAWPTRRTGAATKLSAGTASGTKKTAYLKFAVPRLPAGATLTSATLAVHLQRDGGGTMRVHPTGSNWSERALSAATAPAVGSAISTAKVSATSAVFDVTKAVTPGATGSYAVTNSTAMSALRSREQRAAAPALTLAWTVTTPTTAPRPTTTTTVLRPTTTTTVPRPTTITTVPPVVQPTALIGMSAPRDEWNARLAETGPVQARRLFGQLSNASGLISLARSEVAAGRMPIMSFKLPNDDWAGGASGAYDAQLRNIAGELAALPGRVFVTIHHEPAGDGEPAAYAAMQRRVLPILGAPTNVDAGVIVNGFWWSARGQGYTDAEIAAWLPADVLELAEVVAADTYQGGTVASPGENAGVKIRRLSEWATRVGVDRLGIGEYNGLNAASIEAAGDAILADPRYVFAAVFNSSHNNREGVDWLLTGDRLSAFKATLEESFGDS